MHLVFIAFFQALKVHLFTIGKTKNLVIKCLLNHQLAKTKSLASILNHSPQKKISNPKKAPPTLQTTTSLGIWPTQRIYSYLIGGKTKEYHKH